MKFCSHGGNGPFRSWVIGLPSGFIEDRALVASIYTYTIVSVKSSTGALVPLSPDSAY